MRACVEGGFIGTVPGPLGPNPHISLLIYPGCNVCHSFLSSALFGQFPPAIFTMSSVHLVTGRPTERFGSQRNQGIHSKTRLDHLSCGLRAVFPACLHLFPRCSSTQSIKPYIHKKCSLLWVARRMYSTQLSSSCRRTPTMYLSMLLRVVRSLRSMSAVRVHDEDPYRTVGITMASNAFILHWRLQDRLHNTLLLVINAAQPAEIRCENSVSLYSPMHSFLPR